MTRHDPVPRFQAPCQQPPSLAPLSSSSQGGANHQCNPPPHCAQVGTISEAYPHLVLDNLGSKLGARTANILKHLFPVPKVRGRERGFDWGGG